MLYQSVFSVRFHADSDREACIIAGLHHEQLRDDLLVEGADHPFDITLVRVHIDGRDVLESQQVKRIS